jgi:hypothetical protein
MSINIHTKVAFNRVADLKDAIAAADTGVTAIKSELSRVEGLRPTSKVTFNATPILPAYAPYSGTEGSIECLTKAMVEKKN